MAAGLEEALYDAALYYSWYANRYHWTPEQVENLPWLMQDRLMAVETIRDQVDREKRPKE